MRFVVLQEVKHRSPRRETNYEKEKALVGPDSAVISDQYSEYCGDTNNEEQKRNLPFLLRPVLNGIADTRTAHAAIPFVWCYSCAGSGSIVFAFTGTCTSSRYGDVMRTTRIRGKASMNDV